MKLWNEGREIDYRLIDAVLEKDIEEVRRLLDQGANPNVRVHHNETALTLALIPKDKNSYDKTSSEIAKLLIEKGNADVRVKGQDDMTPLHWAAIHLDVELARLLLERGADVNAQSDVGIAGKFTALDYATPYYFKDVTPRHQEMIELLKQYGGKWSR